MLSNFGRREMNVWHFPEQECDIVTSPIFGVYITQRYLILCTKDAVDFPDV